MTLTSLNSCLNKDEEIQEPSPVSPISKTTSVLEKTIDYSGELSTKQVKLPILHARDTITIEIYPIHKVTASWDFLERKQLGHKLSGINKEEYCYVNISTFSKFIHEEPFMENLKEKSIAVKLNSNLVDINKNSKWTIKSDHIEVVIMNPHLKGAELIIENKTIENIYETQYDTRACAGTKILKYTKKYHGNKIEKSQHYVFDYNIN
jgi:hypothetical protein